MQNKNIERIINLVIFIAVGILYVAMVSAPLVETYLTQLLGGGFFNLQMILVLGLIIISAAIFIINLYSFSIFKEVRYLILTIVSFFMMGLYATQQLLLVNELFVIEELMRDNLNQMMMMVAIVMLVLLLIKIIVIRSDMTLKLPIRYVPFILLGLCLVFYGLYIMFNTGRLFRNDVVVAVLYILVSLNLFGYVTKYIVNDDKNAESVIFVGFIHLITYMYPAVTEPLNDYQQALINMFRLVSLIYMVNNFYSYLFKSYLQERQVYDEEREKYMENLEQIVDERTKNLKVANQTLQDEINAAQSLQKSMMPAREMVFKGVSFISNNIPCENMSGDFLDIYEIDNDKIGMYILDVSGHGINAALMNIYVYHYIRSTSPLIKRYLGDKPKRNLQYLYEKFNDMSFPDEMHLVMMIAAYYADEKKLYYSSGGLNTEPILVRRNGDIETLNKIKGFPICKMGSLFTPEYVDIDLELDKGDRIIFFTDGLLDERQGFDLTEEDIQTIMLKNIDKSLLALDNELRSKLSLDGLIDDVTYFIMQVD